MTTTTKKTAGGTKVTSKTALKKALREILGYTPGEVRIARMLRKGGGDDTYDLRERASDEEATHGVILDNEDVDTTLLRDLAKRSNGLIADLYVYLPGRWNNGEREPHGDLDKNVTLVMAAGGELICIFDPFHDPAFRAVDPVAQKADTIENWWCTEVAQRAERDVRREFARRANFANEEG